MTGSGKHAYRAVGAVASLSDTGTQTNNACENAIGRAGKTRHKALRGYQSVRSAMLTSFLLASLGGVLAGVPYASLLS